MTKSRLSWKWWVLNISRWYIRNSPIARGKTRLSNLIQPLLESLGTFEVTSQYNTRFQVAYPEDTGWECLYVLETYETGTSDLCQQIVMPGDAVFDVGANLGWYTVLFAQSTGATGRVYAFEPIPWIYDKLRMNCLLNELPDNVTFNQLAVSDSAGQIEMFTFEGRSHGETSVVRLSGRQIKSSSIVQVTTLDEYIRTKNIRDIALIKVDAEGAEQAIVQGAAQLLASPDSRPMWLIEINFETADNWSPHDLLRQMQSDWGYRFVRVNQAWGAVLAVDSVTECGHGDNVLCFVPANHASRLARVDLSTLSRDPEI